MANKNEAKIKFSAETSQFNESIKTAESSIRVLNSGLKLNAEQMKTTGTTSEQLQKQYDLLEQKLKAQQDKVEATSQKYKAAVNIYGENSDAAKRLAVTLNNTMTAEEKIKQEINNCEKALADQTDALKKEEKGLDGVEKGSKEASDSLDQLEKSAKASGDGFTVAKGAMASFIGNGLTSLVSSVKDGITSILNLSTETREYRSEMNKLSTASEQNGLSADKAKGLYKELYGVLGDETASSTAIANMTAMHTSQENLSSLVHSMQGIWAQYGDSIPLDGLAESINETAKVSQVTGNLADALNWAGVNEDDFNTQLGKCSTEQERQQLIVDTLNGKYGSLADSYLSTNANVIEANKAQSDYNDAMARMGEKMEPIKTAFVRGITEILDSSLDLADGFDPQIITDKMQEAFGVFKSDVLPVVKNGVNWISEHKEEIPGAIKAIAIAIAATSIITTIASVASAIAGIVVIANPIGLIVVGIVAGITLLVAGITLLWNKSETFRMVVTAGIDLIKQNISDFVTTITGLPDSIAAGIDGFKNTISDGFNGAKDAITGKMGEAYSWLNEHTNGSLDAVKQYTDIKMNEVKQSYDNAGGGIKGIMAGAMTGVQSVFRDGYTVLNTLTDGGLTNVKTAYDNAGGGIKGIMAAMHVGIQDTFTKGFDALDSLSGGKLSTIKSTFDSGIDKVKAIFQFTWEFPKIGMPDLAAIKSTISSGIDKIKSVFNFTWKFPDLKVPEISVTGGFSIHPPSAPHFSLSWHKDGGIMTQPTIFGMTGNTLHVGGEAGAEAILPISLMEEYITNAMTNVMASFVGNIPTIDYEKLGVAVASAIARNPMKFYLGEREFGRIIRELG